jgi:DNA primase
MRHQAWLKLSKIKQYRMSRLTPQDAQAAKIKNIIEISFDFSTMTRVFAKESSTKILERLEQFFAELASVTTRAEYDGLHSDFCKWFTENVWTAAKTLRNERIIPSRQSSYGQAAKVLDVAAKVYVYYCSQPSPEAARQLVPMLHAALDTDMMRQLCRNSRETIQEVDRAEYERLQTLVTREIGESDVHPVQYDDLMWRKLQRAVL